jgi:hypothetical protein
MTTSELITPQYLARKAIISSTPSNTLNFRILSSCNEVLSGEMTSKIAPRNPHVS